MSKWSDGTQHVVRCGYIDMFFFKQKTAYEMRISDWSSDVCSSDLFDAIELNEAFASQSLAVLRALGLPDDAPQVNPNGGAIALGHPLGMSGARLALTLVHQLGKTGGKRGLATLCVGVGMGVALAVERV